MLSRRKLLLGASAVAAAAVAKANVPAKVLDAVVPTDVPAWCPRGFLPCDGRLLLRADFPKLFALLGNTYGGDGPMTFRIPDLRGHCGIGFKYLLACDHVTPFTPVGAIVAFAPPSREA